MEYIAVFILILIIIGTLFRVFGNLNSILSAIINHFFKDQLHVFFFRKPLQDTYKMILTSQFIFYQNLNPHQRDIFERKVQRFIDSKLFIPGNDLDQVTDEMKTLIAATAVQISFGFPRIFLVHFKRIYVYQHAYRSTTTGHYHQGEVHTLGAIVLSWDNFVDGWADATDGRNLGLHEMAHALKIEDTIPNSEYNFFPQHLLNRFNSEGHKEIERMQKGLSSFFRPYSMTNDHEFFAVAVENFFERPDAFRAHNPELYKITCKLLNQDPLRQKIKLH